MTDDKPDRIPYLSDQLVNIADDLLDYIEDKYQMSYAETRMTLYIAIGANERELYNKIDECRGDEEDAL